MTCNESYVSLKTMKKKKPEPLLSEETIEAVIGLGVVLRKILTSAIADGRARIENGKVIFIKPKENALNRTNKKNTR